MRKIPFLFLSLFLALFGLVTMASLVTAANTAAAMDIPNSSIINNAWQGNYQANSNTVTVTPITFTLWDFEDQTTNPIIDLTGNAEATRGPGLGTSAFVQGNGGSGTYAWNHNNWSLTAGPETDKYIQFKVDLRTYAHIEFSFDGYRSGTGPQNFAIHYSTDGVTFAPVPGATGSLPGGTTWYTFDFDFGSSTPTDLAISGQPEVWFRVFGYSATGTGGTLRVDDVRFVANIVRPTVIDTMPVDGAANVALTSTVTITFSEAMTVTADWFALSCTTSGPITGTTVPASPAEAYVITPANPFVYDEACTVTVLAAEVTNSGGLTMTTNYSFTFATESLIGDITFVYHDLEGVLQAGESIYLAGDFTDWITGSIPLNPDAAFAVFSVTVPGLTADTYEYKYIVNDGGNQWDWLNTTNRSLTVSGDATINDYRNVTVGYAVLEWPPTLTGTMYAATADVYGQLYINNVTNPPGEGRGLKAEVGYGDSAVLTNWAWFPMSFFGQSGNNDEFAGVFTPTLPGVFSYTVRFDGNWGAGNPNAGWTYGDLTGVGPYPGGDFSLSDTGVISVSFASVPIAVARAGSNGEIFGLEGVVTVQNNTWGQPNEWAFQDESGGIAAFFMADPPISLGDTVRVVATRGSFNNQEQMIFPLYYFDVVSAGTPPDPITYTTGQVAAGDSEGWLIYTEGIVSGMPTTCGTAYNITLNDGSGAATIRIEAVTGINLCNLGIQNGDMLGVTGFSTQFNVTYQVKPRSISDLNLFVDVPVVISTFPANNATNVLTDTLITIQFNEPVTVTNDWFGVQCHISGNVPASSSPADPSNSYTITPDDPFVHGEICHVTVLADEVSNDEGLNMFSDYQFNFTVGPALAFGSCDDTAVPIHFVQGSGLTTPIFGTTVVVEAVVVGSYQGSGQFNGFFLQERDDRADDDPMTSEGIFVFGSGLQTVAPGELVRVRGTATEFNNLTQVASVTNLEVCGAGYDVTPAEMTLPVDDMMVWEAVEGMLVSFTHELYVTEHFNLGRFGEVHLSVDDRLWNPTNIVTPGVPALALQDLNDRSRIILDDGLNIQNPDPVIYPDPKLTYTNTLRTGATVPQLTGVLDYRASSYRIQPVGVVDFVDTADRPYEMDDVGGDIQVASFNVLNYFITLDTGANICGPDQNMGCRGANTAFEFERQRAKILNAILEMDADIVGLIEIENHHADAAVIDLVAGLNDIAGAGTYAYVDTGVIGTDAIKQAFIYQPAAVTPVGDYAILDSSVDPSFIDTKSRPVLIQTFADNATGELFTVAVNHLKSKGSPCDDVGDPDMGDGQGNCNVTRTTAAQALVNYLATDPTDSGSDRFLIIGDINAYAMEDPIMAILNAGYTDLLREYYSDQAYSYVFDGQFGHLDHGLASQGIMPFVTGATAWHINADEPRVLDYNVEFKTAGQIAEWYSPEPFRSSDHDPVIIGLFFPTVTILTPEDGDEFESLDGSAVTVPVVITTTDFMIPGDGHWHLLLNGADQGPVMGYTTTLQLSGGVYTITAQLRLPDHTSLNIVDSVTIEVTEPAVEITAPEDGAVYFVAEGNEATVGVTIATTNFDIPDDGHWHLWLNGVDQGPVMGYTTTLQLPTGAYTITAQLRLPDHTPLDFLDSVMVEVIEAAVEITAPEDGAVYFVAEGHEAAVGVTITTTNFDIPIDGHWHLWLNSVDQGPVMGYTTTLQLSGGVHTITVQLRLPDHTPLDILDSVTIEVIEAAVEITAPEDGAVYFVAEGDEAAVGVTIITTNFDIPADGHWHLWVNGVMVEMVYDYATTIMLGAGTYEIIAELVLPNHSSLGIVESVTVHVTDTDIMITSPADGATFTSINNAAVTVPVVITTTSFSIPDDGYWRLWLNGEPYDPAVMTYETTVDLLPGVYAISAELVTAAGLTVGNIDTVTVTVTAVYQLHLPIIMNGASGTAAVPTTPTPSGNVALLFSLPLLLVGLPFARRSNQLAR